MGRYLSSTQWLRWTLSFPNGCIGRRASKGTLRAVRQKSIPGGTQHIMPIQVVILATLLPGRANLGHRPDLAQDGDLHYLRAPSNVVAILVAIYLQQYR